MVSYVTHLWSQDHYGALRNIYIYLFVWLLTTITHQISLTAKTDKETLCSYTTTTHISTTTQPALLQPLLSNYQITLNNIIILYIFIPPVVNIPGIIITVINLCYHMGAKECPVIFRSASTFNSTVSGSVIAECMTVWSRVATIAGRYLQTHQILHNIRCAALSAEQYLQ